MRLPGVLSLFLLLLASIPFAQSSNEGREFLAAFLPNALEDTNAPIRTELHLTSSAGATVRVEYPLGAPVFSERVNIPPGEVVVVLLADSTGQPLQAPSSAWIADQGGQPNLVHASSDRAFVAYLINRKRFSSDAALALPTSALGTRYFVSDFASSGTERPSHFIAYAIHDGTLVTVTPSADIVGHGRGIPFTIRLDRGEGYYAEATQVASLAGTEVVSDLPIGVVNGNMCVSIPATSCCCDHVFELAQPVVTWGKSVVAANLSDRPSGSYYRIIAAEDSTSLSIDGTLQATLNAGGVFEMGPDAGSHVFEGDKPIFVSQFMSSSLFSGGQLRSGDPSQTNLIPTEQFARTTLFSTVGGNQFDDHCVTIYATASDAQQGGVRINDQVIPSSMFSAIGQSGFSSAVLCSRSTPLFHEGSHRVDSVRGHALTVSGYNTDDSYMYPGGGLLEPVNCTGSVTSIRPGFPPGQEPRLSIDGCPAIGQPLVFVTENAAASAFGCLLIGESLQPPTVGAGELVVGPPYVLTLAQRVAANGSLSLTVGVPLDPALNGRDFYAQAVYIDPSAPGGLALTEGLRISVRP